MDQVYCVFRATGEGDGCSIFDLMSICQTIEKCNEIIANDNKDYYLSNQKIDLVYYSMDKSNNYTYIGKREDCKTDCRYFHLGGYVIEKMEILK